MKLLLIIALILNSTFAHAAANNDDLMLQLRTDQTSLNWLIQKTTALMKKDDQADMVSGATAVSDITIPLNSILGNSIYLDLASKIGGIFHLAVKDAALRVRVPSLGYRVHKVSVTPRSLNIQDPKLEIDTQVEIQGITADLAQGLQIDFMMTNPDHKKVESYFTAFIDATSIIIPKTLEPIRVDVDLQATRDTDLNFELKNPDVSGFANYLKKHAQDITTRVDSTQKPLSVDQMRVNPVMMHITPSIVGTFAFDAFKPLIQNQMQSILSGIFAAVGDSLKHTIGPSLLQKNFSTKTRDDLVVANPTLYTRLSTSLFSQPEPTQLAINFAADICTGDLYKKYGASCTNHETQFSAHRVISDEDLAQGKKQITDKLASQQADLALSVSEDFINRLIKTSLETNLWDSLAQYNVKIGPKGAFLVFNKETQNPDVYVDVVFMGDTPKDVTNILINKKHPIRFPIRLSTALSFPIIKDVPHLKVNLKQLDSTPREITKGIPEYDMPSKLLPFNLFKGKIVKRVQAEVDAYLATNKAIVDFPLPMLTGFSLDQVSYEASPYGRLNLYFK